MFKKGQVLNGTYQVIEQIGSGGGGIVYKAFHLHLNQLVAIKLIKSGALGDMDLRGETDILKQLKHPYLPRVFDFVVDGEDVYTVMDYIPGTDFQRLIKGKAEFEERDILKWAAELCDALRYLHTRTPSILHCDIKPANIILMPTGDICLIDFNISVLTDGDVKFVGFSKGYFAPELFAEIPDGPKAKDEKDDETYMLSGEQWDGGSDEEEDESGGPKGWSDVYLTKGAVPSVRSDIYGLGASLYSMVTGNVPDFGMDDKSIDAALGDVSEGLKYIIKKAMKASPNKRYRSVEEMSYDIAHKSQFDAEGKRRKTKKAMTAVAIAGISMVVTVAAILAIFVGRTDREKQYSLYIQNATDAVYSGDEATADEELLRARGIYKDRAGSYFVEALKYYCEGETEECIKYVDRVIETYGKSFEKQDKSGLSDLWTLSAEASFDKKDYKGAAERFSSALKYSDGNAALYRDYAIALVRNGETDRAKDIMAEAEDLMTDDFSAKLVESEILLKSGDCVNAEKACIAAIDGINDPIVKERAVLTAVKIYSEGSEQIENAHEKATELLKKTLDSDELKNSTALSEKLAEEYIELARSGNGKNEYYQKAADCYEKLIMRGAASFYIWNNLAVTYQEMDNFDKASEVIGKMEIKFPGDYRVAMEKAFLEADKNSMLENSKRNYDEFFAACKEAEKGYKESSAAEAGDSRMNMLNELKQELISGGWGGISN